MKIMLIIPPVSLEERYGKLKDAGTLYPPLGLAYIAAVAEKDGHEVRIVDSEAKGYSYVDIKKMIKQFKPGLVGMQTYCTNIQQCCKVAQMAKKIDKDTKVVLGGAQVTLFPAEYLKKKEIDFVVAGEGETAFSELISCLKDGKDLSLVGGIVWKKGKKTITNKKQELIHDLDSIPLPARHLFPMDSYHSSAQLRGRKTLNIMTSRGCPYRCAYCSGHINFGRSFRYFSTQHVIDEIKHMIKDFGIDGIQFYDETFTVNKKRVYELCDAMIANKIDLPWACFTRVNLVDEDLLRKMKGAGCYQIFFGIESGNQRLLDMIKKDITLEQARTAVKLCRKVGIESFCSFMLNLPSETVEESKKTVDFAMELDPDYVQFPITTPFPGTELYGLAKEHGSFITEDWSKFMSWDEVVFVSKDRSVDEIKLTVKKAYKRFYMRPTYAVRLIKRFSRLPPSKMLGLIKAGIKTTLL
ncbi:hypothetical protein COV93_08850 [Candidatus Woesearchaeota archaeon CG11_big_fil_rev_8_21_14_0_20_43_8]|nr:MAG: hypothetical protein COV93_08850 [Candidatus Woesearchaeota archaeon CG11_big_fil_rev_8_21_14_0_20_43_8]PIO04745.1 MAG: hypothetical protein COT47_07695 [Candidatus Woesearchaeota archaeon CG08_land_8_20_14_0_20_43_7]